MKDILFLAFSMNRPLQVEGAISSIKHYCQDLPLADIKVIYKSDEVFNDGYETVKSEHTDVCFIKQNDFKQDVFEAISHYEYVVFIVDDNLFTEKFYVKTASSVLSTHKNILVFSYRLGLNIDYCYPMNSKQKTPVNISYYNKNGINDVVIYNWQQAELDFAYPMDVSSSMYRTSDVGNLLMMFLCNNPNQLESCLDMCKSFYGNTKQFLACYKLSVAFCNPINKVSSENKNRSGSGDVNTLESLLVKFNEGKRIDVAKYEFARITGCHQEMPLYLRSKND